MISLIGKRLIFLALLRPHNQPVVERIISPPHGTVVSDVKGPDDDFRGRAFLFRSSTATLNEAQANRSKSPVRIISSSEYYDQLSAEYRQISQSRRAYLAGIERLIAESLRSGLSLLDVGGADGVRSRRLAHEAGISRVTLLDSSPAMLSGVDPKNFEQIIAGDITSEAILAQLGETRFDAALLLWNVLGHISTPEGRLRALTNIQRALRPNGILFLDCNNRENARTYGWRAAGRNWLLDLLNEGSERGNFPLSAKNAPDAVSYVHIFSPRELRRLAAAAGFEIDRSVFVDYETGQPVKSRFEGQIFLQLRKRG